MTYGDRQDQLAQLRAALRAESDPAERLAIVTSLLGTIGQLAVLAPTEALRAAWLEQYRQLQPQAAALRASEQPDPPPEWLLSLDRLSDRVIGAADTVLGGVEGIASGAGGLARALPLIVIVLLVVVAIGFFKGTLRARV